jgi:hypothetical protein
VNQRSKSASGWKTIPRRALIHLDLGRRALWHLRRSSEVDFWAGWLTSAPRTEKWARDREERLDPETEIRDPVVGEELERIPADEISILDVGAGPLTWLGFRYPIKKLTIVPVDPLADEYDWLLRDAGLDRPSARSGWQAKRCSSALGKGDSTSHTRRMRSTTARIPSQSTRTWSPSCVQVESSSSGTSGTRAKSARYLGLHHWNFDVADNSLLLWNNVGVVNVGSALAERAATSAWIAQNEVVARLRAHESES